LVLPAVTRIFKKQITMKLVIIFVLTCIIAYSIADKGNNFNNEQVSSYTFYNYPKSANEVRHGRDNSNVKTLQNHKFYNRPNSIADKPHSQKYYGNTSTNSGHRYKAQRRRNPFSFLRNMWTQTRDGTSRLFESSLPFGKLLLAVPLLSMLAYDLVVPKRVLIRRSIDSQEQGKKLSL